MADQEIRYACATPFELSGIIALYREGGWWKETEESHKRLPALINNSLCFLLAFHQDRIIGMGRVISDGVSDAYIHDLIVQEGYRSQGIGLELVKRLTEFCLSKGLEWIGLIATPQSIQLYERAGFQPLPGYVPMLMSGTTLP